MKTEHLLASRISNILRRTSSSLFSFNESTFRRRAHIYAHRGTGHTFVRIAGEAAVARARIFPASLDKVVGKDEK